MEGAYLRVENLSKSYGTRRVLDGVNFEQAANEIVCLLGSSGSGKTTTLMLIAGLDVPNSGEVWINNQPQTNGSKFVPPEKRQVGFVFQDYALFPHLTVGRNVAFGVQGKSRPERQARVMEELQRLGMEKSIDLYPHELSGGERQRVALARAMAADPKIILMDEPFASLDKLWREKLRSETIQLLRARGCPCVFVTHDPEEACYIADSIVLLDQGRVLQQGKPAELYHAPKTLQAAQFFGKVNQMPARIVAGAVQVGESFTLPLSPKWGDEWEEGAAVVLAFRPEALSPTQQTPLALSLSVEVKNAYFLGKMTEFILTVRGTNQTLTAQVMGQTFTPHLFYLDPQSVWLFRV